MPLPFLGNVLQIAAAGGLHHYTWQLEKEYGSVFTIWLGMVPWVMVTDADVARQVLFKNINRFNLAGQGTLQGRAREVDANGLVFVKEKEWRAVRRAIEPSIMYPAALKAYLGLMDSCAVRLVERLAHFAGTDQEVNIWRELGAMAMDVVGGAAFGVDLQCIPQVVSPGGSTAATAATAGPGRRLADSIRRLLGKANITNGNIYMLLEVLLPDLTPLIHTLARLLPSPALKSNMAVRWVVLDILDKLMADWKVAHSVGDSITLQNGHTEIHTNSHANGHTYGDTNGHSNGQVTETVKRGSFLDQVLSARSTATGQKLTDDQVAAQAWTFVIAGYDTTSTALGFAVYALCCNPEAERKLVAEVDAFGRDREPTVEDLVKLPYLCAVLDETLRLYPAALFAFRETTQPQQLCNSGMTLPGGVKTLVMMWNIHRKEEYWPRALDFLPERFLPDHPALAKRHPHAYLPFGLGPRMCVGYKFALQEARLALLRLYQRYTFQLAPGGENMRTTMGLSLQPESGAIPVRVLLREPVAGNA